MPLLYHKTLSLKGRINLKKFLLIAMLAQVLIFGVASAANETLPIIYKPIEWTENRERLIEEYAQEHYGMSITSIIPQAVVIHWTATSTFEGTYNYFYDEAFASGIDAGTLNVASHFVVDRDGTIYRLTPENALNRHAIGYNWCAIGIENVGGVNGREDLTAAQLQANINLIRYLCEGYPTIKYIFGHYQQVEARASGLFIENIPDYFAEKIDPGEKFMQALRENLEGDGLIFF